MGKGSKGCDQREMKDGGFMGIPDLHPYEECTRLKSGFRGQCGEGDVKYCSLRGTRSGGGGGALEYLSSAASILYCLFVVDDFDLHRWSINVARL